MIWPIRQFVHSGVNSINMIVY